MKYLKFRLQTTTYRPTNHGHRIVNNELLLWYSDKTNNLRSILFWSFQMKKTNYFSITPYPKVCKVLSISGPMTMGPGIVPRSLMSD